MGNEGAMLNSIQFTSLHARPKLFVVKLDGESIRNSYWLTQF